MQARTTRSSAYNTASRTVETLNDHLQLFADAASGSPTATTDVPSVGDDEPGDAPAGGSADDGADDTDPETDVEAEEESEAESLPLDLVFSILKNRRRRLVLEHLREEDGAVPIGDLAEHIAAYENDKTVGELTSAERKRVYVGLYQCHLPKMEDAGIVNSDRNVAVELGPNADQLYQYLETDEEPETDWSLYYSGIAVTGGLLFLAGQITPFAAGFVTNAVVLLTLTAITALGYVHARADDEE